MRKFLFATAALMALVHPAMSADMSPDRSDRPSAVGHRADLLYAACKAMPNVVERRHFR